MDKEKEKRLKNIMQQELESTTKYGHRIDLVQKERTKKLNEIVEKGRANKKEHDIAFKLFKTQMEAKANKLDSKGADFYEEEVEEFKKGLLKEREAIIKKYEDIDKFIAVEYMETLTKYNREIDRLYKEMKEKSEKMLEKINLIAGTHLQTALSPLSYKTENWRKLMEQKEEK